ncbi:hypothetical protein BKA63DRAFT_521152 [Paraphoma chrysanthemicola]|nr:hypothetical protein BKA63DRAFT_521152 [Paraphoma chrysanthemicola]
MKFIPARQPDYEQTSRSSHEMLAMDGQSSDPKSASWTTSDVPTLTSRSKRSSFPLRPFLILSLLPLALAPIITLSVVAETASQSYIRGRSCYPNGLWKYATDATWEIMDSSYFFTPNLSFGSMTFTQVKVIDIAWDLIIGRGGQIMLAWVNYRVFNEWLVWHMEQHFTSWKMYACIAFEPNSLNTLGTLFKEFLTYGKGTWKRFFRRLAIVCMFFSTLYVLSFPTLMAAMTGYIAKSEPYAEDSEGNLMAWGMVDKAAYVINDASRIGYAKPLIAGARDEELIQAIEQYLKSLEGPNLTPKPTFEVTQDGIPGFGNIIRNGTSTWSLAGKNTTLSSPSLNLTSIQTTISNDDFTDYKESFYCIKDCRQSDLYSNIYMLSHTSCKPGETYQWGFSYIFLFMISIFNFVWSCIMVGMWMDTRRGSRVYKSGRRPGLLRSIIEYAAAVREEIGNGIEDLEEEELKEKLRTSKGKLLVPKEELKVRRVETGEEGLTRRGWKRSLTRGSTF